MIVRTFRIFLDLPKSSEIKKSSQLLVLEKRTMFREVFAEGSLPERRTLVLEKRSFFCEGFAEGSLPERHAEVLKYGLFYKAETFVF